MEVRRAGPDDAPACAAVVAAVAAEGDWLLVEAPVDVDRLASGMRRGIAAGSDRVFVLVDGDAVVGTLGVHPTVAGGVDGLGMAVAAFARGRGGGGALVDAALADADARRVAKVELEVFSDNVRAVRLYASRRFVVEGLRRAHYPRRDGTRRDVLVMARFRDAVLAPVG